MDIKACLLTTAWLLPLVGFAVEIFGGYWSHHAPGGRFRSRLAAYLSVGCIGGFGAVSHPYSAAGGDAR